MVSAPVQVQMACEQELDGILEYVDNNGTWAEMARERDTLKKKRLDPEYGSYMDVESSDFDPKGWEPGMLEAMGYYNQ